MATASLLPARRATSKSGPTITSGIFFIMQKLMRKETMLTSGKIVGFVPTRDYDKARAFYEKQLGFEFVSLDQYALVMNAGGHKIRITKVPNFTHSKAPSLAGRWETSGRWRPGSGRKVLRSRSIPLFKIVNSEFEQRPPVTK
jgi:hypothetical protein